MPSSIKDRILGLERIRAGELVPHEMNPRTHPPAQREALLASFEALGVADRILGYRREDGKVGVIDGHLRREEVSPEQELPVLMTDLTEAEARLMLQVADPLAAMAGLDVDVLAQLQGASEEDRLAGLIAPGPGLDELLGRKAPGLLSGADPDAIPEEVEARCKVGDLWALGEHRLLCGDCTDGEVVKRLMGGERAKLLLTDPPYAVDYVSKARDMNRLGYGHSRAKSGSAIQGDALEAGQEEGLWRAAFDAAFSLALDQAVALYIWHAPGRPVRALYNLLAGMGVLHHQSLIWFKPMVIGRCDYQWNHETCFYGWKQGHRPPFYGAKNQTTVWQAARDAAKPLHPTQKPVVLFDTPILNHLRMDEALYDPFVGSGTAIIAAERNGRRCFACEIEPHHADTCLARYELATGRTAERLEGV